MAGAGTVYVLGGIAAVFLLMCAPLYRRYAKTKDKPSLYFGITCLLWALAAVFGISIAVATSLNYAPLTVLFYRASTTSGMLAYFFAVLFAVAMTKNDAKRGIWVSSIAFFVITLIVWVADPAVEGVVGGTTEFTLTSLYKVPYGLPLIETVIVLMVVLASFPIYLFLHGAKVAEDRVVKTKSYLMSVGMVIASIAYSVEVTGAVPYTYMPVYRPMIFFGAFVMYFSFMTPKQLEKKIMGITPTSENLVKSFIEEFFVPEIAPITRGRQYSFSKTFGLNHQQMVGRRILLEFDPASHYEKAIQDFAAEALGHLEPIVIFTRRGSTIHSSLSEQKGAKFFCLTQQVSAPKEFSENEMLLPSNDTSLMLDVFDKTLKANPQGVVNVVFDSLSDLVLSVGFDKTYRFMRYAVEMLASPWNTVLFLLNQNAHDPKVASSLRGLFSDQISFGKEGIQTIKLSKAAEVGKVET
jgi:hypothetical protein